MYTKMTRPSSCLFFFLAIACTPVSQSFVIIHSNTVGSGGLHIAFAENNDDRLTTGKGFAKKAPKHQQPYTSSSTIVDGSQNRMEQPRPLTAQEPTSDNPTLLQSVNVGSGESRQFDNLTPEERAKKLLREKYGMKTVEEERMTAKQLEQLEAQRKRTAELKAMADADEGIDFITLIPGPVIQGITKFLQAGIVITGILFIGAGLGITLEAWSKTSGDPLPADADSFIVNIIEPNFTTMLLVLLGFSISLGGLASAQLGSKSAQYKEEN